MGSLGEVELQEENNVASDGIYFQHSRRRNCCAGPRITCGKYRKNVKGFGREVCELCKSWHLKEKAKKICSVRTLKSKFPIVNWLPTYRWKHFQGDMIAGLTVGLTVIPQGLAYAIVAGLSPEYGLYSAFMGCFIYIFFGTSKDITLGPTAIMSLLTAEFAQSPIEGDATYAIIISLVVGAIQLFMGIANIGFIVDYISHPVINSFTSAAAITIAWGQMKKWLALKKIPRDFIYDVIGVFQKLPETRLWDFLLGLVCILALHILKKMREIDWGKEMSRFKKIVKYIIWLVTTSRNAVIVIISSGVAYAFLQHDINPFSLTGHIKPGLPPFRVPDFSINQGNITRTSSEILTEIGPGFAIIALLGLVETIAIGKAFARKNNYDIDANQELIAIGASNILGCFVGAYPVTGSFSRTAVNSQSGVMTPAGGIWTAVLVLLSLSFLTPMFYYIPDAALAAVIIMAVVDMVDFSLLPKLWRIKKLDLIPWIVTFICCLLIGVEWGVVIGVALSLLMLLYPWSTPKVLEDEHCYEKEGKFRIFSVEYGLLFPGIEHFTEKLHKKLSQEDETEGVIVNMHCVSHADYTTVESMEELMSGFNKRKKRLIFCSMKPEVLDIYQSAKLKHFEYARSVDAAIKLLTTPDSPSIHSVEDAGADSTESPSASSSSRSLTVDIEQEKKRPGTYL